MCGISGFNWEDGEKIKTMTDCLSHRGPDAAGFFTENGISLGHNRLAIIDLSSEANQPMSDNDGHLTIVFNGEIYNFLDLRKELLDEYDFKTKSDTEVILAGYKKWGRKVVNKLDGMFAFAIWNKKTKELFCARDHAGIKPFYYFWEEPDNRISPKRFVFASEIKAILKHDIPRKLNKEAMNAYFRVLTTPFDMTMIENVHKLLPGHTLILKDNSLSVEPYNRKYREYKSFSYSETVSNLKELAKESVKKHLIADVPVGVYLSGGLDSSTVLSLASKFKKNIETFSVGFKLRNSEEENKFNHDFNLAKQTADFFGTNHNQLIISSDDIVNYFEEVSYFNDDPVSNPTSIVMYLLSKYARKKVKVVLTGSGGDEIFGGYDRYRIALFALYYRKIPTIIRKIINRLSKNFSKLEYMDFVDLYARFMFEKDDKLSRVINSNFFVSDGETKKIFQKEYFSKCEGNLVKCLMKADQDSWLTDYFFTVSDKMSMANALEERVPLISRDLKEFANRLPLSFKVGFKNGKKILRDAFRKDLPEYLFNQPKRGWFSPAAKWFREPGFLTFAKRVLSEDYYDESRKIFDWRGIENILERHVNKEEYNLTILWALLTFQVWAKTHKIIF